MTAPYYDALDDFAGPGGWDQGAAMLGLRTVGIEYNHDACRTAVAAGHARIRADVATYPSHPFARMRLYLGSPPCQAWSMAGNRLGEADRDACHRLVDRMADGDDSIDFHQWADPRSHLVAQPVRRIRDLMPETIALEEVPQVAPLWEHIAHVLRGWGYSVWTGDLLAADYGVPQTRLRRILIASRVRTLGPPPPTHAEHPAPDLFGPGLLPWVTWGQALGSGPDEPAATISGGGAGTGGWEPFVSGQLLLRMNFQANAAIRTESEPAPTIMFGDRSIDARIYPPGETKRGEKETVSTRSESSRPLTVREAGILQSFPPDYPWTGTKTSQGLQAGNAIPPLLAAHIIAAATGLPMPATLRGAA